MDKEKDSQAKNKQGTNREPLIPKSMMMAIMPVILKAIREMAEEEMQKNKL